MPQPPAGGNPQGTTNSPINITPPVLANPPANVDHYQVTTLALNTAYPGGLAIDDAGTLYASNDVQSYISKIEMDGTVSGFAGLADHDGHTDGNGPNARFEIPEGMVADGNGNIFVADTYANVIREITPGGTVSTIAGNGKVGLVDGLAKNAEFSKPFHLAIDRKGNLYATDLGSGKVRKITPDGRVSTINSPAIVIPTGIAVDSAGNIFVSSEYSGLIYKIKPDGAATIFAGGAAPSLSPDGNGTGASFKAPTQMAIDAGDNLYVADMTYMRVRKITPDGTVTTIAGALLGFKDGDGADARFSTPSCLTLDHFGNIYVGDYGNSAIRKISPVVGH